MIYTSIICDTTRKLDNPLIIWAKQNDTESRFLKVRLTDSGKNITVSASNSVVLEVERSDGMKNSFPGVVNSDGTVTVPLSSWVLSASGKHRCAVSTTSTGNAILTTLDFYVCVEANRYNSIGIEVYVAGNALPAGNYYVTISGDDYSFTTTQTLPAGGVIRFNNNLTIASTYANEGSSTPIEDNLAITRGATGTQLASGVILNLVDISTTSDVQAIINNYS